MIYASPYFESKEYANGLMHKRIPNEDFHRNGMWISRDM